jgi:nucleoside-diphosphate-sugar epimerase
VFRPNFIVGPIPAPRPYVDNLIYDFIRDIHDTGVIELAGNGQYRREWMHHKDAASAVALAVASAGSGCETYILCGQRVTMHELATRIINQVGSGCIVTNPNRSGFSIVSSSRKARRKLGWEPMMDLDGLISEIWNEYRSRGPQANRSRHGG